MRAELTRRRLVRVLAVAAEAQAVRKQITAMVAGHADHVAAIYGAGPIIAARFLAEVVDIDRYTTRDAFASANGSAPLAASSGRTVRHRFNRGGNRRLNYALYIMAITQTRAETEGRAYYDRKRAEGKTAKEAVRCLKRRLSDHIYKAMRSDAAGDSLTGRCADGTHLEARKRPSTARRSCEHQVVQKLASLWSREPTGVIEFVDATWQDDEIEWRPGDTWTACWNRSLVADVPPYPGVAVRTIDARTAPRSTLQVNVQHDAPESPLHRVATTILSIGPASAYLSLGATSVEVPLPGGDYDAETWVDAAEPRLVSHVAIWLRARTAK